MRLLLDAAENFPAWLDAIRAAKRSILFESYIFDDDDVGREFAEALARSARAGRSRARRLRLARARCGAGALWTHADRSGRAGARLQSAAPRQPARLALARPSQDDRDRRRGRLRLGPCASARKWLGDPARQMEPWRDTGVEIRGPAVAELEHAFAQVWRGVRRRAAARRICSTSADAIATAGDVALARHRRRAQRDRHVSARSRDRVARAAAPVARPTRTSSARRPTCRRSRRRRATASTCACWCRARATSRRCRRCRARATGRCSQAGVRVFEWNGTMLHAKTAVADGLWARIGSTNLNIASWMGNYELDVAIEDAAFGAAMAAQYESDLDARDRDRADAPQSRAAARTATSVRAARGARCRAARGARRRARSASAARWARRSRIAACSAPPSRDCWPR